jgi:Zn-dependent protease with chaperone function
VLPDLAFLLGLLLALGMRQPEPASWTTSIAGTAAALLAALAAVRVMADRAVAVAQGGEPVAALLRMPWLVLPPLVAWSVSLTTFGWGALVFAALPEETWLLRYVVLLLPMVVGFAGAWAARARVEAAAATAQGRPPRSGSTRDAIRAGLRRNGLALIPTFLLLGLFDGMKLAADWGVPGVAAAFHAIEDVPQATILLLFGVLAVLAWALPAALTKILPSEPFPAGPMRDTLERLARAIGLRYREMRVWKTGGKGLNAMVVGLTPGTRRIFVTDGLLDALPTDEVQAVFCHEAAHAQRSHLVWFLALSGVLSLFFMLADELLQRVGISILLKELLYLGILWFGVLGWVSRKFEREADVDGGDQAAALEPDLPPRPLPTLPMPLPEGPLRMVKALKRLEGIVGNAPSHRHGTLSDRAAYVAVHATHPEVRARFAGHMRRLRWGFAAVAVGLLAVAALRLPSDLALARALDRSRQAGVAYERAFEAQERDPAGAQPDWRAAHAGFRDAGEALAGRTELRAALPRANAWLMAGDAALRGLGDAEAARVAYERALKELDDPAVDPLFAREATFTALVDLARVLARLGRPLAEARALELRAARAIPTDQGDAGAYYRARLLLLAAVLEVRERPLLDRQRALQSLGELAKRPGNHSRWVELRRDARDELALATTLR